MLDLPPPLWLPAKPAVIRPADPEMLHQPSAQQMLQALTMGGKRHRGRRAAGGLSLTQKGYGHIYDTGETANLALSYGSVDGGSAPAAGDLVAWAVLAYDGSGTPIVDLTGSGWTQSSNFVSFFLAGSILTKEVVAGDVSSPPNVVTGPAGGSIGFWVAYTVTGSITSLSILPSPINLVYSGASAPANQTCNSSGIAATEIAITVAAGGGTDDTPSLSISGASADVDFTSATNQWLTNAVEDQFMVNKTVGGANITFSKSDDGGSNHMISGYITVS